MGHFSNGTEGMMYQEEYCERCLNYRDKDDGRGYGCPIWDAHLIADFQNKDHRYILDVLIPIDERKFNEKCAAFLFDGKDHDTIEMFEV